MTYYWIPLLIWTVFALLLKLSLQYIKRLSARHQYHFHLALLSALPLGYLSYTILHSLPTSDTAVQSFPVIHFELPVTASTVATTAPKLTVPPGAWIGLLVLILAVGIIYMCIRLVISQKNLRLYRLGLKLMDHNDMSGLSHENRDLMNSLQRNVRFAFIPDDSMPMTFGLFQPVIVLPGLLKNDAHKLNLAISHELEHIRQHDYLQFWLIRLLKAFFWFHPLIWRFEKNAILYREMDIDETVISQNREISSEYAHLLLDLAGAPTPHHLLPTGLAMRPSTIKKRITAMTQTGKTHNYRWISASLAILTLLIAFAMGCSDMQNQDLSGKKLVDHKLTFSKPQITINDHIYLSNALIMDKPLKVPALGITFIMTPDYGTFLISGQSFDGAKPVGTISGNHLKFELSNRSVNISSESQILPFKTTTVWVKNVNYSAPQKNHWFISWAQNLDTFNKRMTIASTPRKPYVMENGKKVYVVAEKMPRLIGGLASIQSRVQYPKAAREAGIHGRVYIMFTVDKQGNVADPKVMKGIGHGCDQAALNAVKQAKFKPGMQDGKPVNVRYSIPIVFRLQ